MKTSFRIARIFGIDVYVHASWFIILLVVVVSLAVQLFPALYPDWGRATTYTVSALAALLLFASVLAHELAHSIVAQSQGIRVKSITLFLLGGVSSLQEEPRSAGGEAFMAAEIAMAESGGNQYALSPTNDYGYWQINGSHGPALATFNPIGNANAAIIISNDGSNWDPWTTYVTGAYQGRC